MTTKPYGVPITDALLHQLSEAHYGETPRERAERVEMALLQQCVAFEKTLRKLATALTQAANPAAFAVAAQPYLKEFR